MSTTNSPQPPPSESVSAAKSPVYHLAFLDGIRALAALYIVVFHTVAMADWEVRYRWENSPKVVHTIASLLDLSFFGDAQGHLAVNVFIVLSGYCLMLPVVKHSNLRGGFRGFIMRRARRILPPYYAACALSLLVIAFVPGMQQTEGRIWSAALPAFTYGNLLAHLFLVHNFFSNYILKIVPAFWSVATEWQIYFFFPLMLLPIWRRWGNVAVLTVSLIFGVSLGLLFPQSLGIARSWYLWLFAAGMIGAVVSTSAHTSDRNIKTSMAWGRLFCASVLVLVIYFVLQLHHFERYTFLNPVRGSGMKSDIAVDLISGFGTACLLLSLATGHDVTRARLPYCHDSVYTFLSGKGISFFATYSYTLYLTHMIFINMIDVTVDRFHIPKAIAYPYELVVGVVAALICSYFCFLVMERPFLRQPGATG